MAVLLVTHTMHFHRSDDGGVYVRAGMLGRSFWSRYTSVFSKVVVAARVRRVACPPDGAVRSDGDGVEFVDLPDFTGPWAMLARLRELRRTLHRAIDECDACCLRVPCPIASICHRELIRRGKPFGLEVVGDPWDSLGPGSMGSLSHSIVRPCTRRWMSRAMRRQCQDAAAVAYVTREALQRRYPASENAFVTHYSSIDLPDEAIRTEARTDFAAAHRLIHVGDMEVLYKGPDVLLRALAATGREDLRLVIVGDGRAKPKMERLAASLGLHSRVEFVGRIARPEDVRAALDRADLFVLPSRQEGVPRAMIEAMARGLPCIGSTAGGTGELLPACDLVPPGDVAALTEKITEMVDDPARLATASARNLDKARDYVAPRLQPRREQFYREFKRRTAEPSA